MDDGTPPPGHDPWGTDGQYQSHQAHEPPQDPPERSTSAPAPPPENVALERAQGHQGAIATGPAAQWAERMKALQPRLQEAATRHLTGERLVRVFLGLAARNPQIRECTPTSVITALTLCAQTGLEPGGVLGHVYLIPRRNRHAGNALELNFQPGYKGWIELARRSGLVTDIGAAPVYSWEVERGLFTFTYQPPEIVHKWTPDEPERDDRDIVGGYAFARLAAGPMVPLWLPRQAIEKRRAKGSSRGGVWREWYPEMVRKTCLRALLSGGLVPLSAELSTALEHDADDWRTPPPQGRNRTTAHLRNLKSLIPASQDRCDD